MLEKYDQLRANLLEVESLLQNLPESRYSPLARTKTEEARMLCGKMKGCLGSISPYTENKKTVGDIEPRQITVESNLDIPSNDNVIETLSYLRTELNNMASIIISEEDDGIPAELLKMSLAQLSIYHVIRDGLYLSLIMSRMYMGEMLGEIRG